MTTSVAAVCLVLVIANVAAVAGPIFPTRGFLIQPRWTGSVDTSSIFDHGGYWAQVQHGFNSDSDRWAWTISMGAIFEFARWSGTKSLIGYTGMELIADDHSDIDFKPRGAVWHEGLTYAVRESNVFNWEAGITYNCRHDIDNRDPLLYSNVLGERTIIYGGLDGKAIWTFERPLNADMPTMLWLHANLYLVDEDNRIPYADSVYGTNYRRISWSIGPALKSKLIPMANSAVYLEANADFTAFGTSTKFGRQFGAIQELTTDVHAELGYELQGRAGRIQFYGGFEQWQDDGQTPIPRNAHYAVLGVRVTGTDLVSF